MERNDTPPDFVAFRESFVNVLCHQDYQDHTRKPEIRHFTDCTIFWNLGDAFATGDLLEPGPKEVRNPNIAIAFRRIGFSENAGWGLNDVIANWTKLGHTRPIIKNGKASKDFEITLMAEISSASTTMQVGEQVGEQVKAVLKLLNKGEKSKQDILTAIGLSNAYLNYKRHLVPLLDQGLIAMTLPEKPQSRKQKYIITAKGKELLENAYDTKQFVRLAT